MTKSVQATDLRKAIFGYKFQIGVILVSIILDPIIAFVFSMFYLVNIKDKKVPHTIYAKDINYLLTFRSTRPPSEVFSNKIIIEKIPDGGRVDRNIVNK